MVEAGRVIVFGAHPDDCDIKVGGTAALWTRAGFAVRFVSITNGDAGHQSEAGAALARRRRSETARAGAVLGVEYLVLDNHDGELLPTLENRRQIIHLIREFRPLLVLGPRPNDYHPDHRAASMLVQDAAYMVTVPNVVALAEHLPANPIFLYTSDRFQRPYPFTPEVVIDIDAVADQKIEALACHESQMFEWLPYNAGVLDEVPADEAARQAWFGERMRRRFHDEATRFRAHLVARYGPTRGERVQMAEAFEVCEYGAPLTPTAASTLFPF